MARPSSIDVGTKKPEYRREKNATGTKKSGTNQYRKTEMDSTL
jgi:hypothetical protein